eukprot:366523-Chlamydomonas_euryale.AAC.12
MVELFCGLVPASKWWCSLPGAIKTVGKSDISNKLKRIHVRSHMMKDHVAKKDIKIMYVESAESSADFLTKPLPREVLNEASVPYGQRVSDVGHEVVRGCRGEMGREAVEVGVQGRVG